MGVDFEKWNLISQLEEKAPFNIYCITGRHAESDCAWVECAFFNKADAEKAYDWLEENRPIDHGLGQYKVECISMRKWKGDE